MAKNGPKGKGRKGAVKGRSQVFSGRNKRFTKVDKKTGKFTQFHFDPHNKQSLSSDSIQAIHQDARSRLWIGTYGGGLNLYHPETNTLDNERSH